MAKKKRKKSRKRKRKNPLSRRRRRRNPDIAGVVKSLVNVENIKTAAILAVGGGAALTIGGALAGEKLGESNVAKAGIAIGSGVLGALILSLAGEKVPALAPLAAAAPTVALGAMALGLWELARGPVEDAITKARGAVGLASWDPEFGSWADEWNKENVLMPGGGAAQFGLTAAIADEDNEFGSYEAMGDIYANQRLGSFESEFGAFEAETALARDQQVRDEMAFQKGLIGGKAAFQAADPGAGLGAYGNYSYGGSEGFGQDDPGSLYAASWMTPTFQVENTNSRTTLDKLFEEQLKNFAVP